MGRGQSGLENPERERTYWLATVRPEGWPHVMPLLSLWLDDAVYFLNSETTRKAAMQVGCAAYLPKPFSANALVDGINRVLGVDADEVSSAPNNSVQAH